MTHCWLSRGRCVCTAGIAGCLALAERSGSACGLSRSLCSPSSSVSIWLQGKTMQFLVIAAPRTGKLQLMAKTLWEHKQSGKRVFVTNFNQGAALDKGYRPAQVRTSPLMFRPGLVTVRLGINKAVTGKFAINIFPVTMRAFPWQLVLPTSLHVWFSRCIRRGLQVVR